MQEKDLSNNGFLVQTEEDNCSSSLRLLTVNFLNIRTPKTFVVITLKFELCGSTKA